MQKVADAAAAVPQCARAGAELALQVLIKCDQRWRHLTAACNDKLI